MVSQAVRQSTKSFQGIRPFNLARDMAGVARLLEEAFREDLGFLSFWSRIPGLREVGTRLWAATLVPALPDSVRGYVWEEGGRIIGNVTLSPDEYRRRTWLISNVAVYTEHRRRGIARELMEATIQDAQERGANALVLNVRPWNAGAISLYQQLGFDTIDTEMTYVDRKPAVLPSTTLELRPLRGDEHQAAFEMLRAGMSEALRTFRPPRPSEFGVAIEDRFAERVTDFVTLQHTERWGLADAGNLRATVTIRAQRVGTPHSFDIRVAPASRGSLEPTLVGFVLKRLSEFPERQIQTRLLTSHVELVNALADTRFVPARGLMLMARSLVNKDE